jgi:hypothetical protein
MLSADRMQMLGFFRSPSSPHISAAERMEL